MFVDADTAMQLGGEEMASFEYLLRIKKAAVCTT